LYLTKNENQEKLMMKTNSKKTMKAVNTKQCQTLHVKKLLQSQSLPKKKKKTAQSSKEWNPLQFKEKVRATSSFFED